MKNQELGQQIKDQPAIVAFDADANAGDISNALQEAQDAQLENLRKSAGLDPEREFAVSRSFVTSDYVKNKNVTPDELVESKMVDASSSLPQFFVREPEDVKEIKLRLYDQKSTSTANYKISADGKILQLRHPEQTDLINDDSLIIDLEKVGSASKKAENQATGLSEEQERQIQIEKQNALLRQVVAYCQVRYGQAKLSGDTAGDFKSILYTQTRLPDGTRLPQEKAFEDKPLCHRLEPLPNEVPEHIIKYNFGRTTSGMEQERYFAGLKCVQGKLAENEDIHQYLDKIVALISRNEGGFETINPDDNGSGISVGIAQWNQMKGELPNLFRAWYKADNAKFNSIFGVYADRLRNEKDESFVRTAKFFDDHRKPTALCEKLKQALHDEEFQGVQVQLVREKALRAWRLGVKYNHLSKLVVAEVADMGNQMGFGGVEGAMRTANIAAIPDECLSIRALQHQTQDKRAGGRKRDKRIEEQFDPAPSSLDKRLDRR